MKNSIKKVADITTGTVILIASAWVVAVIVSGLYKDSEKYEELKKEKEENV